MLSQEASVSLFDFVNDFMKYVQRRGVGSFSYFPGRLWQEFLYRVEKELSPLLPRSVELQFKQDGQYHKLVGRGDVTCALRNTTVPADEWGQRISLRDEPQTDGLFEEFPELGEEMFALAKEVEGLLRFQ